MTSIPSLRSEASATARGPASRIELEAEFGRDHHTLAQWRKRFTDELFVGEGAVDLRCVEERHAAIDGGAQQ
jgi:hypothetical protein